MKRNSTTHGGSTAPVKHALKKVTSLDGRWPMPYPGESEIHFKRRIKEHWKDLPEVYHLRQIEWQIMGHLTFEGYRIPQRKQWAMFFAAFRKACKHQNVHPPRVMFALRQEKGTRKDLPPHFHFLIAALPGHIDLGLFCSIFASKWRQIGGGLSKIERYDRKLDGASYIAKCSDYDSGRAGECCELTFSDALFNFLKRIAI